MEEPDCLREEAVAESGSCGPDAPVPSARWQVGEWSIGGVGGTVTMVVAQQLQYIVLSAVEISDQLCCSS